MADTRDVEVRAVSSYHETAPVGGPPGQGPFLNAAATVESGLDPKSLLESLREIEANAGRVRVVRWGERTLDLDLLLYGDTIRGRHPKISVFWSAMPTGLQVPHPWLPYRRFVLAPAAEIAADMVDPVTKKSIAQLLANLDRRPSYVALAGHHNPRMRRLFGRLTQSLNAAGVSGGRPCWDEAFLARVNKRTLPAGNDPAKRQSFVDEWLRLRESALGELTEVLRADRWSEMSLADQWVVSDFWLDQWWWEEPWCDTGFEARHQMVIEPTFVALIPPWDRDLIAFTQHEDPASRGLLGVWD